MLKSELTTSTKFFNQPNLNLNFNDLLLPCASNTFRSSGNWTKCYGAMNANFEASVKLLLFSNSSFSFESNGQ